MLSLTPPLLRLDTAAYECWQKALDADAGWQAQIRSQMDHDRRADEMRRRLGKERRSIIDRTLGRDATVTDEEIKLALYREGVMSPDRTLGGHQHRHPQMSHMTAAEAKAIVDAHAGVQMTEVRLIAAMVAAMTAKITEFRDGRCDAFLELVTRMESALRERRFAGFWNSVELATSAASEIAVTERDLAMIGDWWSASTGGDGASDWTRLQNRLITVFGKGTVDLTVPIAGDGPRVTERCDMRVISGIRRLSERFGSALESSAGLIAVERPLLVGVDPDRAAATADAHERFVAALDVADRDPEMALVGQQYRTREAIVEGTCRLEQAIGRMGAALLFQMRSNAAYLGARVAANTAAMQEAAGAAATANARLVNAVQSAADRIDVSMQRIPAGWRVA